MGNRLDATHVGLKLCHCRSRSTGSIRSRGQLLLDKRKVVVDLSDVGLDGFRHRLRLTLDQLNVVAGSGFHLGVEPLRALDPGHALVDQLDDTGVQESVDRLLHGGSDAVAHQLRRAGS